MQEIQKLQEEGTSDLNIYHSEENYLHRLLQNVDYCSKVVLNQTKEIMMDSTHDIKRFAEPVLSLLRQKITQSLTYVPYMTPPDKHH